METEEKCHICGIETDIICEICDDYVCSNCTMPYNQFTQIDYSMCKSCGGEIKRIHAEEHDAILEEAKKEEQSRILRNQKQREYYNSEKAREKRRLKRLEWEQQERE